MVNDQQTPQDSFCIIKPNATKHKDEINKMISDKKLEIVASETIHLTKSQAESFYYEHHGKPFFDGLIKFMVSGDVIIQVLHGENAIVAWRTLMGSTNPKEALENTIRGQFGNKDNMTENAVHGSDKPESAAREIEFFFSKGQNGQYTPKTEFKRNAS